MSSSNTKPVLGDSSALGPLPINRTSETAVYGAPTLTLHPPTQTALQGTPCILLVHAIKTALVHRVVHKLFWTAETN